MLPPTRFAVAVCAARSWLTFTASKPCAPSATLTMRRCRLDALLPTETTVPSPKVLPVRKLVPTASVASARELKPIAALPPSANALRPRATPWPAAEASVPIATALTPVVRAL